MIAQDLESDPTFIILHRNHVVSTGVFEQEKDQIPSSSITPSYYYRHLREGHFSPVVRERISNFTDDFYAFNWTEEEQLRRAILNHEVNEAPENWRMLYRNGGIPYKTCYFCFWVKPKTEYSRRQWSVGDDPRCNSCMKKCYQYVDGSLGRGVLILEIIKKE